MRVKAPKKTPKACKKPKMPLCLMSVPVRSATLRLLQGGHLRPRQLKEAFEGVAILALEFQHSGRQERWPYREQPAAALPHGSANPSDISC